MDDSPVIPKRIYVAAGLLVAVAALGTVGYATIEHWTWFQAVYMTITALTTVGGGEAAPLSTKGKAFTLVLIVVGVGVMTYTILALVSFVLEGQLRAVVGSRRLRHRVRRLDNHFVVCGYGRVGQEIASGFAEEGAPFVIVDVSQQAMDDAVGRGYLVVVGNAANVEVLKAAGLERARGLVTALDSDADNIYVALSARVLRPDLFIVARANDADAEPKLRLAGANRVISPYTIGGRRMANLAMRPTAVEFIDTVLSVGSSELLLEALSVPPDSPQAGKPLSELWNVSDDTIILALKSDDQMSFRPGGEIILKAGDELVAAGRPVSIRSLEAMLRGANATARS